jgi:hypothetical protein
MSGNGVSYDSVTIVDQSFQRPTAPEYVMNDRKHSNMLKHRNQGRRVGAIPSNSCHSEVVRSNLLKYRLKRKLATEVSGRISDQLINRAVAEADALAWSTPYPLLFLPGLVEEKIHNAGHWASRQREILARQKALAADSLAIAE